MLKKKNNNISCTGSNNSGSIIQPFEIANAQYYREGTGSYTVVLPPGAKVPQAEIYKTSNLQGQFRPTAGKLNFMESIFTSDICSSFDI